MFDELLEKITDKKDPANYNQEQLAKGLQVELEHTEDKGLAQKIAMDHLDEDPQYYVKLASLGL